jgi:hypothetical protein
MNRLQRRETAVWILVILSLSTWVVFLKVRNEFLPWLALGPYVVGAVVAWRSASRRYSSSTHRALAILVALHVIMLPFVVGAPGSFPVVFDYRIAP